MGHLGVAGRWRRDVVSSRLLGVDPLESHFTALEIGIGDVLGSEMNGGLTLMTQIRSKGVRLMEGLETTAEDVAGSSDCQTSVCAWNE